MQDFLEKKEEEIKEEVNETDGAQVGDTLTPNATEEAPQGPEAALDNNPVEEEGTPHQEEGTEATDSQESGAVEEPAQEKLLTQSQVNELVGRARQEGRQAALKELLERYGVNDENEMNDVFGKGQSYDILNQEFDTQGSAYRSAMSENALLKSHIDDTRWEDVKAILGAKGLDITPENIESLIPSHPEWRGGQAMPVGPEEGLGVNKPFTPEMGDALLQQQGQNIPKEAPAVLRKLGNDPAPVEVNEEDEKEKANKLFGL